VPGSDGRVTHRGHADDTWADAELIDALCELDDIAFQVLYRRHADAAFGLALRIVKSRGRAEDVVQEAFLVVWRSAASFDAARGDGRAWLLGVVRHRALDALRRAETYGRVHGGPQGIDEAVSQGALPDTQVFRHEDTRTVRTALDTLPREQAEVVELAYFAGLTHAEIAERLDLPLGTVKGRMRLALLKLRERLDDGAWSR